MNINWKVRFKNKPFLVSLFAGVLLLAQQVGGAFGFTMPVEISDQLTTIFNSILGLLVLLGIVVDPTTENVTDSKQALTYEKPNDRK